MWPGYELLFLDPAAYDVATPPVSLGWHLGACALMGLVCLLSWMRT